MVSVTDRTKWFQSFDFNQMVVLNIAEKEGVDKYAIGFHEFSKDDMGRLYQLIKDGSYTAYNKLLGKLLYTVGTIQHDYSEVYDIAIARGENAEYSDIESILLEAGVPWTMYKALARHVNSSMCLVVLDASLRVGESLYNVCDCVCTYEDLRFLIDLALQGRSFSFVETAKNCVLNKIPYEFIVEFDSAMKLETYRRAYICGFDIRPYHKLCTAEEYKACSEFVKHKINPISWFSRGFDSMQLSIIAIAISKKLKYDLIANPSFTAYKMAKLSHLMESGVDILPYIGDDVTDSDLRNITA